jgi:hypothetical protein
VDHPTLRRTVCKLEDPCFLRTFGHGIPGSHWPKGSSTPSLRPSYRATRSRSSATASGVIVTCVMTPAVHASVRGKPLRCCARPDQ